MLGQVAGGPQGSDTQVFTGDTFQVQGEEAEEVNVTETSRQPWMPVGRKGWFPHLGFQLAPDISFDSLLSCFLLGLLQPVQPVQPVAEVALGPAACCGLSWDTGLELGVDVAQRGEGLVQDVPQRRVSHGPQDLQRQGQLSLQGHGALPHLQLPQVPGPGEWAGAAGPVLQQERLFLEGKGREGDG